MNPVPAATASPIPDVEDLCVLGGTYDLTGTLSVLQRGTHDPCVRVGAGAAWLCFATQDGPASLWLGTGVPAGSSAGAPPADPGTTAVHVRAWGPGAAAAAARVPRLLGAADDWAEFDAGGFSTPLPRMVTEARRRHRGLRLPATGRMFDALVPAILEQKVTTIEARHAWRYLARKFGTPAPGPVPEGMRIAPGPRELRRIGSWDWHAARVDISRRTTILRAAEAAAGLNRLGGVALEGNPGKKLQTIPGIGPWTAAEVLQRTHGSPDHVSVGDFHLAAYVGYALTGCKTDDAGMLDLLDPWSGHRQRVVRMIGLSGFRKPAFGPRLAPMDHRGR